MDVQKLTLDRAAARELFRKYRAHQHYSEPIDDEIRRAYQLIAQGRLVIRALESIRLAGLNEQKLPKLAIVRADRPVCLLAGRPDGSATMTGCERMSRRENAARSIWHDWPAGAFPGIASSWRSAKALAPLIPVHLRPKRGLANYHVLWEAEWTPIPPRDPYLLRRIGTGDMWLVCAAWDLTEVERAALATRMNG